MQSQNNAFFWTFSLWEQSHLKTQLFSFASIKWWRRFATCSVEYTGIWRTVSECRHGRIHRFVAAHILDCIITALFSTKMCSCYLEFEIVRHFSCVALFCWADMTAYRGNWIILPGFLILHSSPFRQWLIYNRRWEAINCNWEQHGSGERYNPGA